MSDTSEVKCVFWDLHANEGLGDWSEEGCWYSGTENGRHVCSCDHLTNFAILVVSIIIIMPHILYRGCDDLGINA